MFFKNFDCGKLLTSGKIENIVHPHIPITSFNDFKYLLYLPNLFFKIFSFFFFFFKDFIYLFLERGEGKEKEREGNIIVWLPLMLPLLGTWPATQACALTGNRTGNTLACRPFSKYFQVNYRGHHISFPAILG